MAGFLEQVGNVARDAVQGLACGVENYQNFVRRLNPLGDVIPPPPSLWPLLCPDRPPPPEAFPPPPPFEGGQCPGVAYRVFYTIEMGNQFGNFSRLDGFLSPAVLVGPISSISASVPKTVGASDGFAQVEIISQSGTFVETASANLVYRNPIIESIERVDGLPDDCGSPPPPPLPPPAPFPPLPPEDRPVTDPDGGPDIDFTFAPRVGPVFIGIGGGLYVPVEVNISGPNINAPINVPVNISLPDFAPTFNIGGNGGNGGEPGPPDVPCCDPPEQPGPTEEGEEDEPVEVEPDEEGGRLFGVRVASVVNASRAKATRVGLSPNSPQLWVPRIATVVFELKSEDSEGNVVTSTSGDYNVKTTNQLVIAPEGVTVSRIFVTPSKGVQSSATPIYKRAQ